MLVLDWPLADDSIPTSGAGKLGLRYGFGLFASIYCDINRIFVHPFVHARRTGALRGTSIA